jgi:NADPH2:quinone reductase
VGLIDGAMRAIVQTSLGGLEVLCHSVIRIPEPGHNQLLVKVNLAAVNFADTTALATGDNRIQPGKPPFVPGSEVVGTCVQTGQRILALCGIGGYAEYVAVHKNRIFAVPDDVDDAAALALFVSGVTAWHLLYTSARLTGDESVAIPAAAGSVGSIAVQLAKHSGARVVAAASTEVKREIARNLGADTVVDSITDWCRAGLLAANGQRSLDVVLECSGPRVADSLAVLAPFGRLVLFATIGGRPATLGPEQLIAGSRSVSGFWLMDCFDKPSLVATALSELFGHLLAGHLRAQVCAPYDLGDVRRAHRALYERASVGKLVLVP